MCVFLFVCFLLHMCTFVNCVNIMCHTLRVLSSHLKALNKAVVKIDLPPSLPPFLLFSLLLSKLLF